MGLTRRNTIIGLGALAGGAGVIGATGAFTSVEAERSVDIEAEGDAGAQLGLAPFDANTDLVGDGGGDDTIINFDLDGNDSDGNGINLRAVTTFEDELEITNNSNNNVDIDILSDFNGRSLIAPTDDDPSTIVQFHFSDEGDQESKTELGSGDSVVFDIVFDFSDQNAEGLSGYGDDEDVSVSGSVDTEDKANRLLNSDLGEFDNDDVDNDNYLVIRADENTN